jgi:hypothetical protein
MVASLLVVRSVAVVSLISSIILLVWLARGRCSAMLASGVFLFCWVIDADVAREARCCLMMFISL